MNLHLEFYEIENTYQCMTHFVIKNTVTWLEYCQYSIKHKTIYQSLKILQLFNLILFSLILYFFSLTQRAEEDDHSRNDGADSPTEAELSDRGQQVPQVHHQGAHEG